MKTKSLAMILAAAMLTACSDDPESTAQTDEAPDSGAVSVNRTAPARSAPEQPAASPDDREQPLISAPRIRGQGESEDGGGMDMIIYAADREEYQESLQLIAEQTTDRQFQQLDAALRYLMINDPSIMNDEQRLFEFINGKTGTEIMQATSERLKNRAREEG